MILRKKNLPKEAIEKIAVCLCCCLFLPSSLFAILIGNPSTPAILEEGILIQETPVNLRVGYAATFIGDQKLRVFKRGEEKYTQLRVPSRMQVFSLTLNVKERADFSLFSGSALIFPRFQSENFLYELKSRESFFVAGGGKILLIENHDFSFGIDGKYFFFRSRIASCLRNSAPFSFSGGFLQIKEWQITPAISYKTGYLIPYFGIPCRFTKMQMVLSFVEGAHLQFKSLHKAGICLGVSISPFVGAFLNLEGEWLSENAFTLSSEIRF
jgi:hypothetical protein